MLKNKIYLNYRSALFLNFIFSLNILYHIIIKPIVFKLAYYFKTVFVVIIYGFVIISLYTTPQNNSLNSECLYFGYNELKQYISYSMTLPFICYRRSKGAIGIVVKINAAGLQAKTIMLQVTNLYN